MFRIRLPSSNRVCLNLGYLRYHKLSVVVPNLTFYKCDLTSDSDIEEACNAVLESSPPTVLINNAGIAKAQTIMETSQEWLRKIFAINVLCHYSLIQKCNLALDSSLRCSTYLSNMSVP